MEIGSPGKQQSRSLPAEDGASPGVPLPRQSEGGGPGLTPDPVMELGGWVGWGAPLRHGSGNVVGGATRTAACAPITF